MQDTAYRAIAIVATGAILPDAPNVAAFWQNVKTGRYSISEVSADRWDPALYYDPDHNAPDKTYSKIGGWVREYEWDPRQWHMAVPPRVVDAMDEAQKWAIACTRQALEDYGYPQRPLDTERTSVILGNAMAGEKHYLTSLRVHFPEYARELAASTTFAALPETVRRDITNELHHRMSGRIPEITEDTMPGELANCIAGRIANIYNFHGPNFVTDAACASAMAAFSAAVEGLVERDFDVAITGGIDRNMGASTFVKFCKIGALSATGTRPYAVGADGFVMGEGAVIFILKRLADAERDGDRIYAVLRGIGGSSDGKGKGITAPNPAGQKLCIRRAWENAGLSPATATLIEGHGTSTRVGDVVEVESFTGVLSSFHVPAGSVALGSVKSNIGHLKGAAGAAGILKTALALRDKVLPPSVNCTEASPDIDFAHSPLYVNGELKPWSTVSDSVRRAGVSAFGFGGTNFHAVLEEYIPQRLTGNGKHAVQATQPPAPSPNPPAPSKAPLRGALLIGAPTAEALAERLKSIKDAPVPAPPRASDLHAPERLAIDYADAAELADKSAKALKALAANQPAQWKALRAQGIFRGQGPAPKVAFLYTGQGSQYVNMLQALRGLEPIVGEMFAEADRVMTPILGKPLSDYIFVDGNDPRAVSKAEEELRQTAITQPAVLATDLALTRLLAAYGIRPDMTMGHSLGEYGALVAAGALPFADALEAVAARGREMTRVSMADNGRMAAVFAPLAEIERILKTIEGYLVIANINSGTQAVIGGASVAIEHAIGVFKSAGYDVVPLPVSHAFHTSIVAPASEPLRRVLERLHLESPRLPVVANINGEFYPAGPNVVPQMLDILARQMASPVQFVKGLRTLYQAGARVFVEVGPKKALQGFAEEVLGEHGDVLSLFTNHPKFGDVVSFNQALCGLYAAGLGTPETMAETPSPAPAPVRTAEPVTITGAALGLPGHGHIFDDSNVARILRGEQFIDVIPSRFRRAMLDKHITRLVKSDKGGPTFESINNMADVIKLAGRGGDFDLEKEFGVSADLLAALDRATQLAMAAGLDALRDAGIPLVMRYKTTTLGTRLPDRWGLPEAMRDDTGVIFASVFPGFDSFAGEMSRYYADRARREQLSMLESMYARLVEGGGRSSVGQEMARRIDDLRSDLEREPHSFDRRFLFHVLSMGHSQFAEFIGARGPNTQLNAACASTTQAVSLAGDWIQAGRCRRVIVLSADDITTDHLTEWFGAGFLASGAAATDDVVEDAATPFDKRRHGMIMGMGAAALVIESAEAARERGIRPICELLSAVTANSAFHGTRLDVEHISQVMEDLLKQAEANCGIARREIAPQTVFVSHETYTPARGGSAAAEIHALRRAFGDAAGQIVITNTKGFTGHAMGTGIEDVVAVKALETGCVPPVPNFKEPDPELGKLNLSNGGHYPVEYALRLGAGFGSQISMTLLRSVGPKDGRRPSPHALGYRNRVADETVWSGWLNRMAGHSGSELEVVQRTLRLKDRVVQPASQPAPPAPVIDAVREPAPPPPVVTHQPAPTSDEVKDRILALVAEKTGYPADMLDVDLDLEADLGVDTVKQADLFASVRAIYNIPRDENRKLRDYPTLAHVIRFVYENRRDVETRPDQPVAESAPPENPVAASEPRRVPTPTLRPPLNLCKLTSVKLGAGRRIAIMPDKGGVAEVLAKKIEASGAEVLLLDGSPVAAPIHGVYWLPALDDEGSLRDMDLAAWREALQLRVKSLYSTMRGLYEQIAAPDTFLVSATRLGGQHGYGETAASAPMGGAVTGFTKTYKRERPEAFVKAVDFETTCGPAEIAESLIAETLRDPGAVEIGYQGGLRFAISLEEQSAEDGRPGLRLGKDTVFLITGAAGSIVSAITADLAAASGGTIYLLDLTPEPDPNHPDLPRLASDKEGLMRDLHTRIKARGERATPALVEKELAALERLAAARSAIDAVRAAGGTPYYFSVNLTDAEAVERTIAEVRARSGHIDVLLHAAGMERSRFLPDKEPREFDLVFDVKADGWFNLLRAIGDMPLGATVAFSSIAGRFGNAGQADYSSANDLLCKIASSFRATRPDTRAIAIDWTAWGGIGMASRGSIPEMMARAGIDMLPPEIGIPWIRRELTAGATRGEVVVARALGILVNEWDPTGGLDTAVALKSGPMIGRLAGMSAAGVLTIETTLNPVKQPFLRDHQIEGKPVLPGVMGIEGFAEAALCLLPGWRVAAVEEVNFRAPFKFYRGEPRALTIQAVFRPCGGGMVAECQLNGSRSLPGQAAPQATTYFTARVRLTREQPETAPAPAPRQPAGNSVEASDIYRVFFHGPAYQVLERAWLNEHHTVGQFFPGLPDNHYPPDLPLAAAPRWIELCFQTGALRAVAEQGRIGLPLHVDRVSLWRSPELALGPIYATVTPGARQESFDVEVLDAAGNRCLQLSGYEMVAHPDQVDATPFQALAGAMA